MDLLIVEDHAPIRRLLKKRLEFLPGIRVVGEAESEMQALDLIAELRPDVVLLDMQLAPGSGLAVLRGLRSRGATSTVFVLSNQTEARAACLELGAAGFFDKAHDMDALMARLGQHLQDLPQ